MSELGGGDGGPGEPPDALPKVQLEYPLYYTFKALGLSGAVRERMVAHISAVLGDSAVSEHAITARPSSAGKYESISIQVYLQSEDERRRIYEAFHVEKSFVWYL